VLIYSSRITRQGLPAAKTPSGMSRVTMLPAPMTERDPIVTPGQITAAPPRVQRVNVTGRESTFTVPSDGEPASVTLDPDVWLLAEFGPFSRR
jgi:hypothetical protein